MTHLNPFRFVGGYIAVQLQPDTDAQATLEQCLRKADLFQAHIILLGNWLTIDSLSAMIILAEQLVQRNRIGYALSEDSGSLECIKQDAIMVIDAAARSKLQNQ